MKKIAILGLGNVGGGTAEILASNADRIERAVGEKLELKYVLARRDRPESPFAAYIVHDFETIVNDPEVYAVAECIGGVGAAYEYVRRCLLAGKHVCTSNKQLVAEKGAELLAVARLQGVCFLFEGSVGGGVPIIRPLLRCLAANRITNIAGIVNGTTNYILTQMLQCGHSFDSALAEAQRLGYAEADPSADVDGLDALRKACILADICFGYDVDPALVRAEGIRAIGARDAMFAERMGYSIKLLARAVQAEDGGATVFVAPHFVPKDNMLASISGVMNAVAVRGDAVGDCLFYGAGAGSLPTGSAVVADLMDCVRLERCRPDAGWSAEKLPLHDPDELCSRWYVRCADGCVSGLAADCLSDEGECAAVTEPMDRQSVLERFSGVSILSLFRVLD